MPFTDTYANNVLNYLMAKTDSLTPPAAVYIGLCTNDPEASDGSITELSGGGYHRVMISQRDEVYPDVINRASGSDRMIQNVKQINWTKATANWERVNGFFLSSSPTVGETYGIFFYGALDLDEATKEEGGLLVEAGSVCLFDPYALRISFPEVDSAL